MQILVDLTEAEQATIRHMAEAQGTPIEAVLDDLVNLFHQWIGTMDMDTSKEEAAPQQTTRVVSSGIDLTDTIAFFSKPKEPEPVKVRNDIDMHSLRDFVSGLTRPVKE